MTMASRPGLVAIWRHWIRSNRHSDLRYVHGYLPELSVAGREPLETVCKSNEPASKLGGGECSSTIEHMTVAICTIITLALHGEGLFGGVFSSARSLGRLSVHDVDQRQPASSLEAQPKPAIPHTHSSHRPCAVFVIFHAAVRAEEPPTHGVATVIGQRPPCRIAQARPASHLPSFLPTCDVHSLCHQTSPNLAGIRIPTRRLYTSCHRQPSPSPSPSTCPASAHGYQHRRRRRPRPLQARSPLRLSRTTSARSSKLESA